MKCTKEHKKCVKMTCDVFRLHGRGIECDYVTGEDSAGSGNGRHASREHRASPWQH